jgi:hypothetical protein
MVVPSWFHLECSVYYSQKIPCEGPAAAFAAVVEHCPSAAELVIDVQTLSSEDKAWTTIGTFPPIVRTGRFGVEVAGCRDFVRFAYTLDPPAAKSDAMRGRIEAPVWLSHHTQGETER